VWRHPSTRSRRRSSARASWVRADPWSGPRPPDAFGCARSRVRVSNTERGLGRSYQASAARWCQENVSPVLVRLREEAGAYTAHPSGLGAPHLLAPHRMRIRARSLPHWSADSGESRSVDNRGKVDISEITCWLCNRGAGRGGERGARRRRYKGRDYEGGLSLPASISTPLAR
jgi:hypothetical protein